MAYETIEVRVEADKVGVITLNRPKQLNALNDQLMDELGDALRKFDADKSIGCMIITGSERAFAAGADIGAMAKYSFADAYGGDYITRNWETIRSIRKPVIAAVSGFALGGGCELAMHCDIIVAGASARFAQPEVKLGLMPGAGGTQRLVRAVGKFQAMRIALTGCMVKAPEALAIGMVSEVVEDAQTLPRALALAAEIAALPPLAVAQIKEVMLAGADLPLDSALALERKAFQLLFDSADQKEGAAAFFEKRKPDYRGA